MVLFHNPLNYTTHIDKCQMECNMRILWKIERLCAFRQKKNPQRIVLWIYLSQFIIAFNADRISSSL